MTTDEQRRAEQTTWLRGFPAGIWREHAPELWARLPPSVRDRQPPPELWSHKFDLTFAGRQFSLGAPAIDRLVQKWTQGLARDVGHHLLVAHTIAKTDGEGRPHVHGVLSTPPLVSLGSEEMLEAWRALRGPCGSRSVVETYDSALGAIRYALDHGGGMDPNVACPRDPRCRKGRCLGARHPWRPADAEMNEGRAADRRVRWSPTGRP